MENDLGHIQALLNIYVLEANRVYGWELLNEMVDSSNSIVYRERESRIKQCKPQCEIAKHNLLFAISELGAVGEFWQMAPQDDENDELDLTMDDV